MPAPANVPTGEVIETPRSVQPFVRALGFGEALRFLLDHGGSHVYIPANPQAGSPLVDRIGLQAVQALQKAFGHGELKVPLAKPWIGKQLAAGGMQRDNIAKALHVTRESVRRYLLPAKAKARA